MKINISALQNNYLPALIISVLLSASASAQVDTNKVRQQINAYGYSYKNISIDSSLRIPRDTFHLRYSDTGSIAIVSNILYTWNGLKWNAVAKVVNDSTLIVNGDTVSITASGGVGNTDLGYTPSATNGVVTSSTGADATIPAADGTNAGLLKPADYNLLQDSVVTNVSKTDSIVVYRTKGGAEVFRDTTRTSHGIGTIVDSVVYTASGSIDTLTFSKLVDKTALSVEVHPYVLHLTSTTPGTDEVQINATTGGVKFGTALTSGQTVTILYKYTVTDGTAAVTTVNSQTGDVVIDGSETKLAEGANITITGTGTTANPYTVSVTGGTITSSSSTSLSLTTYETYVYTGASSATWTLPAIGTAGRKFYVKNRGTGNLTIQTSGADSIYTNTTTASIILLTGDSYLFQDDGTYWIVL